MSLSDMERLAIEQTLFKRVASDVKAGVPDNLRGRCDEAVRLLYEQTGAKSFDARVAGRKVGTYSVRVSKATKPKAREVVVVDDPAAVWAWAQANADDVRDYVLANAREFAEWFAKTTGEVVGGAHVEEVTEPARPESYAGTTYKVDEQAVWEAVATLPPGTVAGLLEGGGQE